MEDLANLYTREEFIKKLNLEIITLEEWERHNLLFPAGKYDKDTPYYNEDNVVEGEQLKSLMAMGYDINALKKIKVKVGLPAEKEEKGQLRGKLLTVGEMAEKIGVSVRTLKYWEEKKLIEPDGRSDGGFRLYRESFVEICHRIRELQLFGYSLEELKNMNLLLLPDERLKEELISYRDEESDKILDEFSSQQKLLLEKITELKKAIKRWEGIVRKQGKLTNHIKKQIKKNKSMKKS